MQSVIRRSLVLSTKRIVSNQGKRYFKSYNWSKHVPMTKIVATIGPASEQLPMLQQVTGAGMRIMRINFSHATYEEADLRVKNIRQCSGVHQISKGTSFNLRAVMLDTQGPEIRTGMFAEGTEVKLLQGNTVTLTTNDDFRESQTSDMLWLSYKNLNRTVKKGDCILLDDGAVELCVEQNLPENDEIVCSIVNSGVLGNKKGVNLPGAIVDLPPMSEKDKEDIKWGIKNDIDFIAASFTRKASDVIAIREYCKKVMKSEGLPADSPPPRIISKIENIEALTNIDEIIAESEGIMVARGDLGVEIPMETLTNVQKDIIKKCKRAGKPVIVATQMLESMQKNPRPTRAECTDVSNAVFDGADCVMLSGESAKGKYPVQAVQMMYNIVNESEGWITKQRALDFAEHGTLTVHRPVVPVITKNHMDGMASAIVRASRSLGAQCIIVLTNSGNTAINVAKYFPDCPIVAMVPNQKVGRFLQLHRGVHPVVASKDLSNYTDVSRFDHAIEYAKQLGFCSVKDTVIIVSYETALEQLSSGVSMRIAQVTEKGNA